MTPDRTDSTPNVAEAYLDIETTGLSPAGGMVTVVGIYTCCPEKDPKVVQLVGKDITAPGLSEALRGVKLLHTYNGSRFDLPFLHACLGIDLSRMFPHRDLMFDCWSRNLYGGLKSVERQLGIARRLPDMNGFEAVKLWWRYAENFDLDALKKLLAYNQEDIVNLKILKAKLGIG